MWNLHSLTMHFLCRSPSPLRSQSPPRRTRRGLSRERVSHANGSESRRYRNEQTSQRLSQPIIICHVLFNHLSCIVREKFISLKHVCLANLLLTGLKQRSHLLFIPQRGIWLNILAPNRNPQGVQCIKLLFLYGLHSVIAVMWKITVGPTRKCHFQEKTL